MGKTPTVTTNSSGTSSRPPRSTSFAGQWWGGYESWPWIGQRGPCGRGPSTTWPHDTYRFPSEDPWLSVACRGSTTTPGQPPRPGVRPISRGRWRDSRERGLTGRGGEGGGCSSTDAGFSRRHSSGRTECHWVGVSCSSITGGWDRDCSSPCKHGTGPTCGERLQRIKEKLKNF